MAISGGLVSGFRQSTYSSGTGVWSATEIAQRQLNQYQITPTQYWPIAIDPDFASVTCLVHCDEISTQTGRAVLLDRSGKGHHISSNVGNAMPQIVNSQSQHGAYSLYNETANGTIGGFAQGGTTADFGFGTNDFTIECFFRPADATVGVVLDMRPTAAGTADNPAIYLQGTGNLTYYVAGSDRITSGNGGVVVNTWYHIAIARTGTSTKMFIAGTQAGSTFSDSTNYASGQLRTMVSSSSTGSGSGYMSEIRITKGVCRYTSNFSPPTTRFADY